jgi:hypothetical protein
LEQKHKEHDKRREDYTKTLEEEDLKKQKENKKIMARI